MGLAVLVGIFLFLRGGSPEATELPGVENYSSEGRNHVPVGQRVQYRVAVPREDPQNPLILTAWQKMLRLEHFGEQKVSAFGG